MSSRSSTRKATAPASPEETDQTPETGGPAAPEATVPAAPEAAAADAAPLAPPAAPPQAVPDVAPQPAAAPLAPPTAAPNTAPAAPLVAPLPVVPGDVDAFLGYVDDKGAPIDPDDLFDMSGVGTVVTARVRANALVRRGGSKTELMSLAFPLGMEVTRATAQEAIAKARAAVER
ncbi:hypothetical protein ABZ671_18595 [Micromonospora sp. NPDC006766]|uniref:hypothetical protein n=1 Tax=Micromonospora sp. NPDC006766 TaxID=3154778 RepID=UPI0033C3222D